MSDEAYRDPEIDPVRGGMDLPEADLEALLRIGERMSAVAQRPTP